MELPRVRSTSVEVTNPQFRIVEKTDPADGNTIYIAQRKWAGLFWVRIPAIRTQRGNLYYDCTSMDDAVQIIEKFKRSKNKQKDIIHYL